MEAESVNLTCPAPPDWRAWRHVTKLDPDRPLDEETLQLVYQSGTDAIMVGGSTGMTLSAVSALLARLVDGPLPVALEVSTLEAAIPGPALFLIPLVLNAGETTWMGGAQAEALGHLLPHLGPLIPWDLILPEAYLILNPAASAAHLTQAKTDLTPADAAAWAALAGRIWRLPLLYVEYSGTFGSLDLLRAVKEAAGPAHVIYGGGIKTAEQAALVAPWADTVVVGNLVYEVPERLAETVAAVRAVGAPGRC
jgi:putative glycerol-1-phosphate prenyltransferase